MNRASSNLADRKELLRVLQGKRWYRQKGTGTRKLCWAKKMDWLSQGYFPYRGCQGSIKQITDYWSGGWWLIGIYPRFNFWKNCKSWFADVGFIILTTPFWAYCLVLNMMTLRLDLRGSGFKHSPLLTLMGPTSSSFHIIYLQQVRVNLIPTDSW